MRAIRRRDGWSVAAIRFPDQRIRIVDPETRQTLEPAAVGEIWLSGPSVAQGYWRQPDATREIFEARTSDTGEGPFLRTGDLGFLLDGELYVTGRRKDLLIIRGVNHYPQDIENTVEKCHPLLRAGCSAAFAVEADQNEHLIVAAEVERRSKANHEQVFSAIRQAVSQEHDLAVSAIVLLKAGSIPKTSSGKIQRHACQSGVFEGGLAAVGHWSMAGIELPGDPRRNRRRNDGRRRDALEQPPRRRRPRARPRPAETSPLRRRARRRRRGRMWSRWYWRESAARREAERRGVRSIRRLRNSSWTRSSGARSSPRSSTSSRREPGTGES